MKNGGSFQFVTLNYQRVTMFFTPSLMVKTPGLFRFSDPAAPWRPGPPDWRRADGGELDKDGALVGIQAAKDHQYSYYIYTNIY